MTDPARAVEAALPDDPGRLSVFDLHDPEFQASLPEARFSYTVIPPGLGGPGRDFGLPWQIRETFDTVVLMAPKSRDRLRMMLFLCASLLEVGGSLILVAPNRGAGGALSELEMFGEVARLGSKAHHKAAMIRTSRREPFNLDTFETTAEVATPDGPLLCSWFPGVFAAGRLDPATALLMDHLPPTGVHAMDLGTGCGVLTAFLARRSFTTCGFDADAFAVEATIRTTSRNALGGVSLGWGTVIEGHGNSEPDDLCDLIVSNPPFHEGLRTTTDPAKALMREARDYLSPDGQLMIVANGFLPYDRELREHYGQVKCLADNGRYKVWRARP
ncbi:MAG: methyltransferase [Actinomycetota bacterium]